LIFRASSEQALPFAAQFHPAARKLIYCSRTVPEIEKALAELKRLMEYRAQYVEEGQEESILAIGLSSRGRREVQGHDFCMGVPEGTRRPGLGRRIV
jgi:DEAD_2